MSDFKYLDRVYYLDGLSIRKAQINCIHKVNPLKPNSHDHEHFTYDHSVDLYDKEIKEMVHRKIDEIFKSYDEAFRMLISKPTKKPKDKN